MARRVRYLIRVQAHDVHDGRSRLLHHAAFHRFDQRLLLRGLTSWTLSGPRRTRLRVHGVFRRALHLFRVCIERIQHSSHERLFEERLALRPDQRHEHLVVFHLLAQICVLVFLVFYGYLRHYFKQVLVNLTFSVSL